MKNQKGFVNILLITVAVVIIGGGTFYYFNNQSSEESFSDVDSEERVFVENIKYSNTKVESSNEKVESSSNKNEELDRYFVIEELGIRFKIVDEIDDLVYTTFSFEDSDIVSVKLSSETLIEAANNSGDNSCSENGLGSISLYRKGDDLYKETGWYSRPHDRCSGAIEVIDLQYRLMDILEESFNNSSESINEKGNVYNSVKIGLTQPEIIRRSTYFEEKHSDYLDYYKLPIEDMFGNLLTLTYFGSTFSSTDNESGILTVFRKIDDNEDIEDVIREVALDFEDKDLKLSSRDQECEIEKLEIEFSEQSAGPHGTTYYLTHPDYVKAETIDDYEAADQYCGKYGKDTWVRNYFYELDGYLVYKVFVGQSFEYVSSTEKLSLF
jgi:hypothetical protein